MTQPNRPQQSQQFQARDEGPPAPRDTTQPWDYERHLDAEHHMLVDAEQGWPTVVKRYRLFRPMQGKQSEKTLITFTGTGPVALAHFFHYIHPATRAKASAGPPVWRR